MSKIYDDLKRESSRPPANSSADAQPDLFSYAAQQARSASSPNPDELALPHSAEKSPTAEFADGGEATAIHLRRGLDRHPSFSSIIEPLSALPPLRKRSRKGWFYACSIVLLTVIAIAAIRRVAHRSPMTNISVTAVEKPVSAPYASPPSPALPPLVNTVQQPAAAPRPYAPRWLIPGARIETINNVDIISFEEGIFGAGAQLMPAARRALLTFARQLAPYGTRLSITVIGCTDNTPMNPGSRYKDNADLGLARAREVARVLGSAAGLPDDVFHIVSYGERWAPFPNDTPQNRSRNRTVVLRISIKP